MARFIVAGVAVVLGLMLIRLSGASPSAFPFLAALVVFPVLMAVTHRARKPLLAVILLELSVPMDVYLFYNEEIGALGGIGGLNISITTLALAVLYGLWVADVMVKRQPSERQDRFWGAALPLVSYIGVVAVSIVVAEDRALGVYEVAMLAQMFLLYIYLLHAVRDFRDVKFVVTMLMIGFILQGAIMLSLPITGDITVGPVSATVDAPSGRVQGTLGSYNTAAAYLSVMIALAMGVMMSSQRGSLRMLAITGAFLGAAAIILTGSRGGWLALIIASIVLGYGGFRRGWLSPAIPAAMGLAAIAFAVIFQGMLAARLFAEDQSGALGRVPLMRLAGRMIADNPLFGVGANNFALRAEDYWLNRTVSDWLYVVHNKYLLIMSESGFIALGLFLIFLFVTVRFGWRAWKNHDRGMAAVTLGLTAAMLGHMVHFNVDIFNDRSQVQLLWVIAALIAATYRMSVWGQPEPDAWQADEATRDGPSILVVSDQRVANLGVNAGVSWGEE